MTHGYDELGGRRSPRFRVALAFAAVCSAALGAVRRSAWQFGAGPTALAVGRPAAAITLTLSNAYERSSGRPIGNALYPFTNLVDVSQETNVSLSTGAHATWYVGGALASGRAPFFALAFAPVGTHAVVAALDDGTNATFTVVSRIVRRELRELSAGERSRYLGALFAVYAQSDEEGAARYGPDFYSASWLVREHLYGAADRSCDHWHDDAGFVNHHVGITWQLEKALRAVDETTAAHYWDYTLDARLLDGEWKRSPIFDDDWFSPTSSSSNNESVVDGGFTKVLDARSSAYSNQTNPYGLLRSPWNVNKVPFLLRRNYVLDDEYDGYSTFPKCAEFQSFLESKTSIAKLFAALNGELHGPARRPRPQGAGRARPPGGRGVGERGRARARRSTS